MNISLNFLLPQLLREVEVGSTLYNGDCDKNPARYVHFRVCYTMQRSMQFESQQRDKIAR